MFTLRYLPATRVSARARSAQSRAGFTLLEIAVVMGLLVTVTAIAIPSMLGVRQQTALTNAAHILARDLNRARVEAMRKNQGIALYRESQTTYRIRGLESQSLPDGVRFVAGFDSVRYASFGPVQFGAGTVDLTLNGERKTIVVEPGGFAYVQR